MQQCQLLEDHTEEWSGAHACIGVGAQTYGHALSKTNYRMFEHARGRCINCVHGIFGGSVMPISG